MTSRMTERLYYVDPYSREFDATILSIEAAGRHARVRLDRTCFYPTSGGQPCDIGTLGSSTVVEVVDERDGGMLHVVENGNAVQIGAQVHGVIDWTRRFDHMQQHTGQHLLSAAFDRCFGVRTIGFHMGADRSTIDLSRETTPIEIADAEAEANRVVWENLPVAIRFTTAEEADRLPLRKESLREGTLRLIDIEGFDLSACGGTHVARTGEVGLIAVGGWERLKGGERVEFLCGRRALDRFRFLRNTMTAAVRTLSASAADLPIAIERLQADAKALRRTAGLLQTELAQYRAERLAAEAEQTELGRLVLRVTEGDANGLKMIASAVVARPGYVVALVSPTTPSLLVVARSQGLDIASHDIVSGLTAKFGGKGGGKPELAQAGGLAGATEAILAEARRALLGRA